MPKKSGLPPDWKAPFFEGIDSVVPFFQETGGFFKEHGLDETKILARANSIADNARTILNHPNTEKANRIYRRIWNDKGRFTVALTSCAESEEYFSYAVRMAGIYRPWPIPAIIRKFSQRTFRQVNDLLQVLEAFGGGDFHQYLSVISSMVREKKGEPPLKEILYADIVTSLEILKDFFGFMIEKQKTQKPDYAVEKIAAELFAIFSPVTRANSALRYRMIGLLISATYGKSNSGNWSAERTRKYIERARRRNPKGFSEYVNEMTRRMGEAVKVGNLFLPLIHSGTD